MVQRILRWLASVFNGRAITWPRVGSPAAWLIAVALLALGLFSKPLLESAIGDRLPPYITFYATVTISALLGGPRIGLVVTVISVILTWYFFFPPYGRFSLTSAGTLVSLAMFLCLSSFQAWIIGKARMALDAMGESEGQRDRAARESVHRIKNLIAVVQAIASKLAREVQTVPDYKKVLSHRLIALASAQDILVQSNWSDVELADIIKSALAPFLPNPGFDVQYGPAVRVPARHVSGLNMALYELCTNSLKYGALAEGRGPVVLSWRVENGAAILEWREQAPGEVASNEGLGTQLIRFALGADPGCRVDYTVDGADIRAMFCWPAASEGAAAATISPQSLH